MQPYQQRVVDEKRELDERLLKLRNYLASPVSASLDLEDRVLLETQEDVMSDYSVVLASRIARFTC